MDMLEPESIAGTVRRMVEESDAKARRLSALREAIAGGSYRATAAALADSVVRAMRG
jgi:anti-sigma28 factor (negative regulator of flagellin synthesis)